MKMMGYFTSGKWTVYNLSTIIISVDMLNDLEFIVVIQIITEEWSPFSPQFLQVAFQSCSKHLLSSLTDETVKVYNKVILHYLFKYSAECFSSQCYHCKVENTPLVSTLSLLSKRVIQVFFSEFPHLFAGKKLQFTI